MYFISLFFFYSIKSDDLEKKTGLDPYFCDMVLLMAVTHACVADCKAATETFLTTRSPEENFLKTLKRVFFPFKFAQEDEPCKLAKGEKPHEYWATINESIDNPKVDEEDDATVGKNTIQGDSKQRISPNVLSLFAERAAFPKISLCAPAINHRHLNVNRVWSMDNINNTGNPGIIGSLLDVGRDDESPRDLTFTEMDYFVFPYKVVEKAGDSCRVNSRGASEEKSNRMVFEHDVSETTTHIPNLIHLDDIRKLIQLLSKVSTR